MDDIRKKKPSIINLSYKGQLYLPLTWILKSTITLMAIGFFFFGFVYAPVSRSPSLTFAAQDTQTEQQRQELESQLTQLEKQISDYENAIAQYQKQGQTLANEIKTLNSKIAKLNLQIKAVNLNLDKLNRQIKDTQSKISSAEQNIDFNKGALSQVLQNLYENENQNLMEIFLANPQLSDFFGNLNDLMLVQDNLRVTLAEIIQSKNDLLDQKQQLALEKSDAEALKIYEANQKLVIQNTQSQKNEILKVTKGKESVYQKLVTETKKTAAQVRNQIFELLGGGELNFDKAYSLAKVAQDATGVRAAFILAVLDRESALGQNVGRCAYNQIMKGGTTAMNPKEIPIFLDIVQALNINPNSVQISCPNQDGTYGGAMGPAQFIPSTWNIYKNKIAEIIGHAPANPWSNADAFIAAALYLKDAGANKNEKQAAARYYCGSGWNRRYVCLNVYGYNVVKQANNFQKDIDILNS